jgi:predicted nucleic acid-binding protein
VALIVLDASAAVEIALWTADGSHLAAHVATAEEVVVPDHSHLECSAALRRLELREEITTEDAHAALGQILDLRVRRVDTLPLLQEAWGLRRNVTMADAVYVVLARRLGIALVTGDLKLTKAPRLGLQVLTPTTPR